MKRHLSRRRSRTGDSRAWRQASPARHIGGELCSGLSARRGPTILGQSVSHRTYRYPGELTLSEGTPFARTADAQLGVTVQLSPGCVCFNCCATPRSCRDGHIGTLVDVDTSLLLAQYTLINFNGARQLRTQTVARHLGHCHTLALINDRFWSDIRLATGVEVPKVIPAAIVSVA